MPVRYSASAATGFLIYPGALVDPCVWAGPLTGGNYARVGCNLTLLLVLGVQ
ncbi:hypothetical protein [Spirosoma utsteinense]|uniref:Uncharacterized protein n=1 Tax=Spirosoma utsteinense TaxID=2585773 RepID=A0ABR6W8I1_9BACT|nr:hypothetical protein [Spirosoma utsteinense]MBC3785930.1 hypothetical protein [Spirosoma utsteinense]MBC3792100.1 hypothetical protein [Spirosoma utsteinense]